MKRRDFMIRAVAFAAAIPAVAHVTLPADVPADAVAVPLVAAVTQSAADYVREYVGAVGWIRHQRYLGNISLPCSPFHDYVDELAATIMRENSVVVMGDLRDGIGDNLGVCNEAT